jgi:hypothetical protein
MRRITALMAPFSQRRLTPRFKLEYVQRNQLLSLKKNRWTMKPLTIILGLLVFDAVASAQEIITLATRTGVTQSFFLTSVPKNLQAIVILFPGSGGSINLRTENGQAKFNQVIFSCAAGSNLLNAG